MNRIVTPPKLCLSMQIFEKGFILLGAFMKRHFRDLWFCMIKSEIFTKLNIENKG